ncbi:MAG: hypothetical protein KKF89_05580 [Nanoarchaeota archaeon]|nr:hypothetical protein [Nanoarchaeota archaeon]
MSWFKGLSRDMSLVTLAYAMEGQNKYSKKVFGIKRMNVMYYYNGKNVSIYKNKEEWDEIHQLQRKHLKQEVHFKQVLEKFSELIKQKHEFLKLKNPVKSFNKFHKFYIEYWAYHIYMYNIGYAVQNTPEEKLLKKYESILKKIRSEHPYHEIEKIFLTKTFEPIKDIDKKLLFFCLPKELLDYFNKNKIPNKQELKKRLKRYLCLLEKGKLKIVTEKEAEQLFLKNTKKKIINQHIKHCAYPGKVKGTVKIILTREEFYKINEGDILITTMTTPEYIPIMRKASAIVTEEGGILCHAAIITREMKKPCIVGIKNATKVFKDGNLVEVDADKGFVKKIEKC